MRGTLKLLAGVALLVSIWARPPDAAAQSGEPCPEGKAIGFRGFTARLENDLFVDTDRNYTNGISVTAISRDLPGEIARECLPWAVRLQAELIGRMDPGFWSDAGKRVRSQNVVVKLGQAMYTPADPLRSDLVADDRPYAGLLYAGLSWNRRTLDPRARLEKLDTREVTAGVIGPLSLVHEAQDLIHEARGFQKFQGWQHQLKNEPALQLSREQRYRDYRGSRAVIRGFSADTIRSFGLSLGNIETSAYAGLELRAGWNLPNDFGTYPIRPAAENRAPAPASLGGERGGAAGSASGVRPGAHVFAALETKLVAHDFSLDGNLFRHSHSVTRRPFVAQAALGLSIHGLVGGKGAKLAVMRVIRSREFAEQDRHHSFGSVALSIEF